MFGATLFWAHELLLSNAMTTAPVIPLVLGMVLGMGCASDGMGDGDDTGAGECPLPDSSPDGGTVGALKAQRCNVPMSMGARKWYRLSATLPNTSAIVQLELWPYAGAFAGGTVHAGTFPIDPDILSCGVCLRALGDKGGANETEYFATGGTVTINAVGAGGEPLSATISNATFGEVDGDQALVDGGCSGGMVGLKIEGVAVESGGMGGGPGGGGGTGTGNCPMTIGD
ncbi:MAG: hypothetical protein AB7P03_24850 [Kofleriaceae bacterium]